MAADRGSPCRVLRGSCPSSVRARRVGSPRAPYHEARGLGAARRSNESLRLRRRPQWAPDQGPRPRRSPGTVNPLRGPGAADHRVGRCSPSRTSPKAGVLEGPPRRPRWSGDLLLLGGPPARERPGQHPLGNQRADPGPSPRPPPVRGVRRRRRPRVVGPGWVRVRDSNGARPSARPSSLWPAGDQTPGMACPTSALRRRPRPTPGSRPPNGSPPGPPLQLRRTELRGVKAWGCPGVGTRPGGGSLGAGPEATPADSQGPAGARGS